MNTAEIINQIVDVLELVRNNVGNLTKAVKLMDKKLDSLQAENEKTKRRTSGNKENCKTIRKKVVNTWKTKKR